MCLALGLGLALGVAGAAQGALGPSANAEALVHWARVLERFVGPSGGVDFQGLSHSPEDLDAYLRFVAEVSPNRNPDVFPERADRLAHYINSYNALAMSGVLSEGIPDQLGGAFFRLWYFGIRSNQIGGDILTLNTYKNEYIRRLRDPRVHFALNAMTVTDPRLPRAPFSAASLDAELDRAARDFLAEVRNVRIDETGRRVTFSSILKEYEDDFLLHAPSLVAYVNRYRDQPIPEDYKVSFFEPDWTVSRKGVMPAPPPPPAERREPEPDTSRLPV